MCKKVVIGEDVENTDNKNKGIEDYSFSIFNLHISSVGAGIGIIIILVIMYKLIRHSNIRNWSKAISCFLPWCRQPWNQPRHDERHTDDNIQFQNNRRNCQRWRCSQTGSVHAQVLREGLHQETHLCGLSGDKVTKISISSATVDGPQNPAKLDKQARQPNQPPEIFNATHIGPQPTKILKSVSKGPRGDVMDSTKRPPRQLDEGPNSNKKLR